MAYALCPVSASKTKPTARVAAFAAALALCLRLLLPLLHGGAGCDHHVHVGTSGVVHETCSCGVIHTEDGDLLLNGGHVEGEPRDEAPCLACKLEDQSPGGDPLVVVRVPATLPTQHFTRAFHASADVSQGCSQPPSRAPPVQTV